MKQYSFLNTVVLVNGVSIGGWDEGDDALKMSRRVNSANDKVGVDGEMTVSVSANRSGVLVFGLNQSSDSNAYLGGLVSSMENGIFVPILVQFKDVVTGDLASGTQGYIVKPADMDRGDNSNRQDWQIVCERLDMLYSTGI